MERDRKSKLENLQKWHNFKTRRNEAVDKYIIAKRRSSGLSELLKACFTFHMLLKILESIKLCKLYREFKHHAAKLSLMMYIKLGRRMRRSGGYYQLQRANIKSVLLLTNACFSIQTRHVAGRVLRFCLNDSSAKVQLRKNMLRFHEQMRHLQKRMRD